MVIYFTNNKFPCSRLALNNEIGVEVGSLFMEEERYCLYKAHTAKKLPGNVLKKS